MKKICLAVLAVGLIATTASADVTGSNVTRVDGTFGAPTTNIDAGPLSVDVITIESLDGGRNIPYALGTEGYDNWPSVFGGAGAASICVFGGTCTSLGGAATFLYVRWGGPSGAFAQWGDDVHGYIGPSMNHIHYGFFDTGGTAPHIATHTIKIYDMFPPSAPHGPVTSLITKGVLYTSLVVTYSLPSSNAFNATVSFPTVALLSDSMWVKFQDVSGTTFWLSGGVPTIAPNYSHPGLTYTIKYPYGAPYNEFVGVPYFYFTGANPRFVQ
ncbi:MAG: hypothetical protein IID40_04145, partial [Planctomycetes bacterium]|nr:hypothetical protein [Planctomycetota bacterium]